MRVWLMIFGLSFSLAGCSHAQPPGPSIVWHGGNWPTYQYSADHNAVITSTDMPVSIKWTVDVGSKVNGGLAYSGGLLYVTTFDYRVLALDPGSGKTVWQHAFDNVIMSTPVVMGKTLVVGTGDNGMAAHGDEPFAYANLFQRHEPFWGREGGDHVIALNPSNGKVRWSFHTAGEDMPSPVVIDNSVVFANGDGHAYGVQLDSGEIQWQKALTGIATMASAASDNRLAFVSTCGAGLKGATQALDEKGSSLWSAPFGDCDSAPTVGNHHLYLSGVRENRLKNGYGGSPILAAVEPVTGKTLWIYRPNSAGYFTKIGSSERAIAGLYHAGAFVDALPTLDEMVSLDGDSGAIRWIMHSMAPIKMSPIAFDGFVYVGDIAGMFYKVNERTGEIAAARMFAGPFTTSPPIIVNKSIFVVNGTSVNAIPLDAFTPSASNFGSL